LLEACAFLVTEGHYGLSELIDWDHGVTIEELIRIYRITCKLQAERTKMLAQTFMVAIGSLFDAKVMKDFMRQMDRVIKQVDPKDMNKPKDRRAAMIHTMRELSKLGPLLGSRKSK
jgi:hypothetical protein